MIANLTTGTNASVCDSFSISVSINSIVGSTDKYSIQWRVNTQAADATEESRLEVLMNSVIDPTSIDFPSNTLLPGLNYSFTAEIKSDYAISDMNRSIDIQITECLRPPDFNLTGMFYLQILVLTILSIRIDRIGYI